VQDKVKAMKVSKYALGLVLAAAAAAMTLPAAAQVTGTRLPPPDVTVMTGITVEGAIDDGKGERGEDPADLAMADVPVVYEDVAQAPSTQPAQPAEQPQK
jgi:hypothetical protein